DYLISLTALDRETGQVRAFSCSDCQFGYRDSLFKSQFPDRYIVLSVTFRLRRRAELQLGYGALEQALSEVESPTPKDLFNAVVAVRQSKLPDPLKLANAGSFFKNPVVTQDHFQHLKLKYQDMVAYPDPNGMKLAAGWLIDRSGWKGHRQGDVGVHDRQALVLVNYGRATGEEVLALAQRIQADIKKRFQVALEIEPRCY
ncbi:MAG: UDP-N-acetylenolpyruvoylglucosamine reductase, partial [Motiliproteus sp.]|nr:UDP-N-acetylenolpyruvoylglucosamine reductase [Motiliproteus sp.]